MTFHPSNADEANTNDVNTNEVKKRHREVKAIIFLGLLFLVLAGFAFKIFGITDSLPLEHSIFFFGLLSFNITILLLLIFLIFRIVVKSFSEQEKGIVGSTLKRKLIAAFVGFSAIPTTIIFFVSIIYIKASVEKWSNPQLGHVLRNAIDISVSYITSTKKKNYDFAYKIGKELESLNDSSLFPELLNKAREIYNLDAVEYYTAQDMAPQYLSISPDVPFTVLPEVNSKYRRRVLEEKIEMSDTHNFNGEALVRVLIPVKAKGVLVVTSIIPSSIPRNIGDIEATYNSLRNDLSPVALLEPFYIGVLIFITLFILLCATWFGFYLAKQLSIPIDRLTQAARDLASGQYRRVAISRGSPEMSLLINNFNKMVDDLEASQVEIKQANESLKKAFVQLDEHSSYIEIVLSNVSTGVVSIDNKGIVTMVNRHAAHLFRINPQKYVGQKVVDILSEEHRKLFNELVRVMQNQKSKSIQREVHIAIHDRTIPMQMTLSLLSDKSGRELGTVVVLNDLSDLLSAQRSAAWKEVARRIAHEIKNPLTPIRLSAQRLQRKFGSSLKDPAFSDCVQMIIRQVDDLKTIVNEFTHFARLPQSQPRMSSLNKVIAEAMVLFTQAHKEVRFIQDLDEDLPHFLFDPDQIKRVITNLIKNALSATLSLGNSPEITICTKYDKLLKMIQISVIDNGPGFPTQSMDRVFEPYMTTKEHGTGLGLSIVKRVIEDHNGFVRAFNQQHPKHHAGDRPPGAKIVIELPVIVINTV